MSMNKQPSAGPTQADILAVTGFLNGEHADAPSAEQVDDVMAYVADVWTPQQIALARSRMQVMLRSKISPEDGRAEQAFQELITACAAAKTKGAEGLPEVRAMIQVFKSTHAQFAAPSSDADCGSCDDVLAPHMHTQMAKDFSWHATFMRLPGGTFYAHVFGEDKIA